MRDRARTTKDTNQIAAAIVASATDESGQHEKDPAAVEAGRKGGLKGGRTRARRLSAEERSESARRAAQARWSRRSDAP